MFIDVFGNYQTVTGGTIEGRDVVVLDVYRTTSVMVTAIANGARCVIPAESIDEAWELFRKDKEGVTLLGGEREALPIDGFHLDNSPGSYSEEIVRGKRIVVTTSNGTKAIKSCLGARRVYVAGFLNVSKVVRELLERSHDVAVVCSGTFGRFALEDGLCAGMIVSSLLREKEVSISDLAFVMKDMFELSVDIRGMLKSGSVAYGYLMRTGYETDIEYCLKKDTYDIAPFYREGSVSV